VTLGEKKSHSPASSPTHSHSSKFLKSEVANSNEAFHFFNCLFCAPTVWEAVLKDDALQQLLAKFHSSIVPLETGDGQTAAHTVNEAVRHRTQCILDQIVCEEDFENGDDALGGKSYLMNALCFKGEWVHKFKEVMTKSCAFHVNEDVQYVVPTMIGAFSNYLYAEAEAYQAICHEYTCGLGLVVLLPKKRYALREMVDAMSSEVLVELMASFKEVFSIRVQIPKLTFESTHKLHELLPALGIRSLFEQGSVQNSNGDHPEFAPKISISTFLQKTNISVDENGSNIDSNALVQMLPCCGNFEPAVEFVADHPFLYALVDLKERSIFLMGTFAAPTGEMIENGKREQLREDTWGNVPTGWKDGNKRGGKLVDKLRRGPHAKRLLCCCSANSAD